MAAVLVGRVASTVITLLFDANHGVDSQLEYLVDTGHFLAAAFAVGSAHALGDSLALFRRDRCESLRFEEFNACALIAKVGLEADQDERRCWAKVEDFWVPLIMTAVLV